MKAKSFFSETAKTILMALLIVVPIRVFIFQPFLVRGASMEPNYYHGDYLIVDQLSYRFNDPKRGDVIVLDSPEASRSRFIKRIVGLPGEEILIRDGSVFLVENGEEKPLEEDSYSEAKTPGEVNKQLSDNEYFVLGDNRDSSSDSRNWGAVPRENIVGKVGLQLSPSSIFSDDNLF